MKIIDLLFGTESRNDNNNETEERGIGYGGIGALTFGGYSGYTTEKAMLLSTVYRCVELISNSVAMLPFEPYRVDSKGYKKKYIKHPSYHVLNCEPNQRMTRYTFIKLLVTSMLIRGNGYAYIVREPNGDVKELIYIPSEYVMIVPPKYIYQPITYKVFGFDSYVQAKDMIHLLNYSYDGVNGVSTLSFARETLKLSSNSEEHASNFFSGGCNVGGILTVNSILNSKQKADMKESWNKAFNSNNGVTNGLAILEGNMTYQPITVNARDAQLLETREYNVIDICRFFNVNPIKAFDLSHSNYSSSEAANLSFLSETLQPILEKIELEFRRKIFAEHNNIIVKFDISELLKTDKQSQAEYYQKMILNGIMSVNECRKELNLIPVEGGDTNIAPANMLSLKNMVNNIPSNSAILSDNDSKTSDDEINQISEPDNV